MGWLKWLRNEFLFDNEASNLATREKNTYDLDMKQAMDAHRAWVDCLRDLVYRQIDRVSNLSHESEAPPFLLRQWLYGPARKRYRGLLEYWVLNNAHEKFHACSDTILHCYRSGFKNHALRLMEDELMAHSEGFQVGVVRLYAAAAAQR